ncbi:MAG: S-methyl-5'-thioadenosine phosphorylase [Nitrospirota bacterium]
MQKTFESATIGIIGGSGLYDMEGLEGVRGVRLSTPFGDPSDEYILGNLKGIKMAFLPRHGRGHRIMPTELSFRANIYGMKMLGVERIISVSAVGSMKEEIKPGDIVIPYQFYDNTKQRKSTFFGNGIVVHVGMADPVCKEISDVLFHAGKKVGATVHLGGTYLCIEGPQFSTRAESNIYRKWDVDVIGMTNVTEAKLAREAEICYATLALATDYDCWHAHEEDVTVETVVETLKRNVQTAKDIIKNAVISLPPARSCICADALKNAIITDTNSIPENVKQRLDLLIGKYI